MVDRKIVKLRRGVVILLVDVIKLRLMLFMLKYSDTPLGRLRAHKYEDLQAHVWKSYGWKSDS